MTLSAKSLRNVKFSGSRQKLWDSGGLYCHVLKTSNVWRYDCQFKGQRRTAKLGTFPGLIGDLFTLGLGHVPKDTFGTTTKIVQQ